MKSFAIAFALLSSVSAFATSVSADLSINASNFKLEGAEYKLIPTKTEIREIPGCIPNGDRHPAECQEVVVLESRPAIIAQVSYEDTFTASEQAQNWLSLEFSPADFSAEDVQSLKAAYPTWRHPLSRAGELFAKKNLELSVVRAERTIQVVDVRNSKLCPYDVESGETFPGCVDVLVYKPAKTTVNEVTVSIK
jgi:hypothetical protein